jgi:hypothetical protein
MRVKGRSASMYRRPKAALAMQQILQAKASEQSRALILSPEANLIVSKTARIAE